MCRVLGLQRALGWTCFLRPEEEKHVMTDFQEDKALDLVSNEVAYITVSNIELHRPLPETSAQCNRSCPLDANLFYDCAS